MSDEATVERVARALWDADWPTWPQGYTANRERFHFIASAAIAALQPQDGWQDIATAPKTDPVNMRALPFLGWCPDKTAPLGGDIRVIWWEPVMQRADETSPRARWYGDRDMEERPTHWRPLPAPPAAEIERTKGGG